MSAQTQIRELEAINEVLVEFLCRLLTKEDQKELIRSVQRIQDQNGGG